MGLKAYLLKRLVYTIVLVFFVLTLNFIIFEALPGGNGAINNILGSGHRVSQVQIDYLYHLYGLDQPLYVRYYNYIDNMLTLQFGISLQNGHTFFQDLQQRHPATLKQQDYQTLT